MTTILADRVDASVYDVAPERNPYFSWGAAFAGAVAGCAVTVMLLALGAGLGLMLVGPIMDPATPMKTMLTAGGIYFFAVEAFGFAVGGYIAGRLCGPVLESWDEEMFRSGAHGLVVWALAVAGGILFVLASGAIAANTAGQASATFGTQIHSRGQSETAPVTAAYWADTLLRTPLGPAAPTATQPAPAQGEATAAPTSLTPTVRHVDPDARAELTRILTVNAAAPGPMNPDDRARVVQIVSEQTGLNVTDAGARVDTVLKRAHDDAAKAAETARKGAAYLTIWMALALFFGLLVSTGVAVLARWEEEKKDEEAVGARR